MKKSEPSVTSPVISLVVAVSENGVIGTDGTLPWHLPADLRHFKALTMGKPVLMGRKTYESIGRPLPGRRNIVVTRSSDWSQEGVHVVHDIESGIRAAAPCDDLMIIGGGEIYARTLERADRIYLTRVHVIVEGDTTFPTLDLEDWTCIDQQAHEPGPDGVGYTFLTYVRKRPVGPHTDL